MGKYELIYLDPPWNYFRGGKKRNVKKEYKTMEMDDLRNLYVKKLAAPDCVLACWWTGPFCDQAMDLVSYWWDFRLVNAKLFTWHKLTKTGKSHFGMGNWTRANTEDMLIAVRGNPKRIDATISQFVSAPIEKHSAKPQIFRDKLVQLVGDVPRIELFARGSIPGWHTWGLEADGIPFDSWEGLPIYK